MADDDVDDEVVEVDDRSRDSKEQSKALDRVNVQARGGGGNRGRGRLRPSRGDPLVPLSGGVRQERCSETSAAASAATLANRACNSAFL